MGQSRVDTFYGYDEEKSLIPIFSSWDDFPTDDNPNGRYKYFSVHIELSKAEVRANRETYSFLDWLGDVGGLHDGMFLLGSIFVSPISSWALQSRLVSTIVKQAPNNKILRRMHSRASSGDVRLADTLLAGFKESEPIKEMGYVEGLISRFKWPKEWKMQRKSMT